LTVPLLRGCSFFFFSPPFPLTCRRWRSNMAGRRQAKSKRGSRSLNLCFFSFSFSFSFLYRAWRPAESGLGTSEAGICFSGSGGRCPSCDSGLMEGLSFLFPPSPCLYALAGRSGVTPRQVSWFKAILLPAWGWAPFFFFPFLASVRLFPFFPPSPPSHRLEISSRIFIW